MGVIYRLTQQENQALDLMDELQASGRTATPIEANLLLRVVTRWRELYSGLEGIKAQLAAKPMIEEEQFAYGRTAEFIDQFGAIAGQVPLPRIVSTASMLTTIQNRRRRAIDRVHPE